MADIPDQMRRSLGGIFNPQTMSLFVFLVVAVVLGMLSPSLLETNNSGFYAIRQAAVTGQMTAFLDSGMFIQGFGNVFSYRAADILHFSKHASEGGGEVDESIEVRFNDGARARVTGNVRIELPHNPEKMIEIHRKFRSYDALIKDTVKQVVSEAVILTSAFMSAEESYTTKRAEFSQLADDQVKAGVYLTEAEDINVKDHKPGEDVRKQIVRIQLDKDGKPERKESVLALYGIRVTQFVIKEIDYEDTVDQQIQTKQQALMKTVSAKAEAEKAAQDRLTAEEVGKKNVAIARYEQEVEKTKAVTSAEKELDVARLNKTAAEQYKQTQILKAEGDAEYRRKIMSADGALEKKLAAYVETQRLWSDAFAKTSHPLVPNIVMGAGAAAGSGSNAAMNMMEMLSIKAARDLATSITPKLP